MRDQRPSVQMRAQSEGAVMQDFSAIAPRIRGSLRRLDELLREHSFFRSEELSPRLGGGHSSEIWLRREGDQFFAVRVDWLGHAHAPQAHYHLQAFPADRRFDYEHRGKEKVPVTKFDPMTGLAIKHDPHESLVRDDR